MQCVDVTERLLVDKLGSDPELDRHVAECARCEHMVQGLGRLDAVLTSTMIVTPPLELQHQLAQLARPLGALVNLLPLHPGGAPDLSPSSRAQMLAFERRLRRHGVEAVLRRSRGLDISAACGQLRVELEARRKVRPEEHARVE